MYVPKFSVNRFQEDTSLADPGDTWVTRDYTSAGATALPPAEDRAVAPRPWNSRRLDLLRSLRSRNGGLGLEVMLGACRI